MKLILWISFVLISIPLCAISGKVYSKPKLVVPELTKQAMILSDRSGFVQDKGGWGNQGSGLSVVSPQVASRRQSGELPTTEGHPVPSQQRLSDVNLMLLQGQQSLQHQVAMLQQKNQDMQKQLGQLSQQVFVMQQVQLTQGKTVLTSAAVHRVPTTSIGWWHVAYSWWFLLVAVLLFFSPWLCLWFVLKRGRHQLAITSVGVRDG